MKGKGFTLVELLVTISILSILMTIALISYSNIQKGARDGKRKSDISSIQSALEQYHADQGYYPASLPAVGSPLTGGSRTYLTKIPGNVDGFSYSYTAKPSSPDCNNIAPATYCTNYCLYATVESSTSAILAPICPNVSNQYQTQAP